MNCRCDLHIHSALSPCGDMDMTPNNIVNMAMLNGLDMIAITDHNTIGNVEAVMKAAKDKPVSVLAGMELETQEEAHFVCLFKSLSAAHDFADFIKPYFMPIENRPDIFGQQAYMNELDEITGYETQLLTTALSLSIYDAVPVVRSMGGVILPAHVNKDAYSIISNLGFVPEDLGFKTAEISRHVTKQEAYQKWPHLSDYFLITSSDAHYLWDMYEEEGMIDLEEASPDCLLEKLKKGK